MVVAVAASGKYPTNVRLPVYVFPLYPQQTFERDYPHLLNSWNIELSIPTDSGSLELKIQLHLIGTHCHWCASIDVFLMDLIFLRT